MKTATTKIAICILFVMGFLFQSAQSNAQCTIPLNNGKSVTFKFTPVAVIVPSSCGGWGYNYDYKIDYTTTVNGGAVTFWYVGATFQSGTNNNFDFGLNDASITAGAGTITTVNNQARYMNDCGTATPSSLNIRNLVLTISSSEGNFTTNCSFVTGASGSSSSSSTTAPLPVKLISFDGAVRNNKVDLTWVTATETNNAFFMLERSADAQSWEAITKMDGAGTTHFNTTYNYTDDMPVAGVNYYRLKQVDANGSVTYSRTIAVKAEGQSRQNAINFYPNPVSGDQINFMGMENANDWSVKVINTSSTVVYQAASATAQLALPNLATGLYFIQLQNSKTGDVQTLKMMKK